MSEEKMDVIIIGAGPAGAACAFTLAKAGKEVLVIERADVPGAKNVTGGRFYTYALETLEEGLTREAVEALERKIIHEQIMILDGKRSINVDYHNPAFNQPGQVPQSFSILRAKFDSWLAGKAEEMGAMVACGVKVDDLIERNGRIVGVIAGEDEMYADVVVAADGVNSFMAQKAGLIQDINEYNVGVGVKEIIELTPQVIQDRFNLGDDEGAARMIMGCTEGIHGGGFLYTNADSISLGAVFMPEGAVRNGRQIHDIFQDFKMHPAIYPLIKDGETVEYGAHLVSEMGFRGIPKKIYKDGLLLVGDAAGFVINTGYSIRGIDLAIISGAAAARAILAETDAVKVGPCYMQELKDLKVLPTMKAVDGYYDLLEIPRIYKNYPRIATDVFSSMYNVNGSVPPSMKKEIKSIIKRNGVSVWHLLKDGIRGYKSL